MLTQEIRDLYLSLILSYLTERYKRSLSLSDLILSDTEMSCAFPPIDGERAQPGGVLYLGFYIWGFILGFYIWGFIFGVLYLGLYAAITFRHVPEETGNAVHAGGRLSLFADLVGEPDACRALSSCAETAPPPMLMLRSRALCLESNWVANGSGFGDFGGGSWREHPRR